MNGFEDAAILSRIDHLSSSALHVPSRSDTRSVKPPDTHSIKPPFAVAVPAQGVPGTVIQGLLKIVDADGLADMTMTGAAKVKSTACVTKRRTVLQLEARIAI